MVDQRPIVKTVANDWIPCMNPYELSSSIESINPEDESTNSIYQVNEFSFISENLSGWNSDEIKNRCNLDKYTNEFFDTRYIDVQ